MVFYPEESLRRYFLPGNIFDDLQRDESWNHWSGILIALQTSGCVRPGSVAR